MWQSYSNFFCNCEFKYDEYCILSFNPDTKMLDAWIVYYYIFFKDFDGYIAKLWMIDRLFITVTWFWWYLWCIHNLDTVMKKWDYNFKTIEFVFIVIIVIYIFFILYIRENLDQKSIYELAESETNQSEG